jgi:hypothetical protein
MVGGIYYNELFLPRSYLIGAFLPQTIIGLVFSRLSSRHAPLLWPKFHVLMRTTKGWLQIHDVTRRGDETSSLDHDGTDECG